MPLNYGETLYETLIQFEGTKYEIKESTFVIQKVQADHIILRKDTGEYFIIRMDAIKFVKTKKGGQAIDWIVFDDNKQLPTGA